MWLAVNEETITLLDVTSMQSVARVPYSAVVTFGGCQDDLMVVVNNCDIQGPGTQKMLFALPKPKVIFEFIPVYNQEILIFNLIFFRYWN